MSVNPWEAAEKHAQRAEAYYQRGQWDRALIEIKSALAVRPGEINWRLGLALTYEALSQHDLAVEIFEQIIPYRRDDVELLWHFSINLIAIGRAQRALDVLNQILRIEPEYEPAYCQMIAAYSQLGDHDKADQTFLARQFAEPCPVCFDHLAHSLAARGRPAELERAVWCWQQALKLDPHYPDARANLGSIHWQQGKLQLAKYDFLRQLREDPHDIETLLMLSRLLIDLGQFTEADRRISRAIDLEPACPHAHLQLGELLFLKNKLDEAQASLETAQRLDPSIAGIHLGLAQIAQRLGQFELARKNLDIELDLTDHSPGQTVELARLMLRLGQPIDAGKIISPYIDEIAGQPFYNEYRAQALLIRAEVLLELKRPEEAIADLRCSLRLEPHQPQVMQLLATANLKLGRLNRARLWLDRTEALKPNDPAVPKLRRKLARSRFANSLQRLARSA